jgi:hypothetical protein
MRRFFLLSFVACGRPTTDTCLWLVEDGTPAHGPLLSKPDGGELTPAEAQALQRIPIRAADTLIDAMPPGCVAPDFERAHLVASGSEDELVLDAVDQGADVCAQVLLRCVP